MNNQTGKLSGNSGLLFVPQRLMEGMEFAALRDGFYRLDCSKTDLATDLPMVCKFKFVRYSYINKYRLCTGVA